MANLEGNELYKKYGQFIRRYSHKLSTAYSWGLDPGEAEQIAWEAVLVCYKRYKPYDAEGKPVQFENYASFRIRGAIIDEVRKRTLVRGSKDLKSGASRTKKFVSFEDLEETELQKALGYSEYPSQEPEDLKKPTLNQLTSTLTDKRDVNFLRLVYLYEFNLTKVADIYGLSLARISQKHKFILQNLRKKLVSKVNYL